MNISDTLRKPGVIAALCLLIGIALGLLWGWVVSPVQWINATPADLRYDLQQDYLRMVIDSYRVNSDSTLATYRYELLGADAPDVLSSIASSLAPDALSSFTQAVQTASIPTAENAPRPLGSLLKTVFLGFAVVIILVVIVGAVYFLFRSGIRGPKTAAQQGIEYSRSMAKTDFTATGQEAPVAQFVTTYVLGDDLFDDSFSIDSPAGEFLGECGVGISETVGVGDPKKVTAFEVWMFDKNDIQTVTHVLMTRHAFEDPAIRSKLESKGELVLLEPGKQVVLETATLQLAAMIADMQYGQGPLPPDSYVERLSLELAVWQKAPATAQ
jgi:hypothetical protein